MYVNVINLQVNPKSIDAFIEATRLNYEASIKEKGNCRFDVLQDADDPTKFMLYQAYTTAEDAVAHKNTLHYVMWQEKVAIMMAKPREKVKYNCLLP